ncbi:GNAT family N-acetyltransferase [Cryptosporangium sp. NPDC048952]|uniref:GNAT family N-acetyltransferase n=1 Tax=Cryptosporangium sp. NPDC048952 TaxID=3363961 RepID=UPI003719822D
MRSTNVVTDISAATADPSAEAAARAAGVVVRELDDMTRIIEAVNLLASIWGRAGNPPVTSELLRAFSKAGNYVAGAFEGDRLVGACVAFFHEPAGSALHSHIAGVSKDAAGRGVGFALKLHQRAWALRRDVADIVWTFDPLVARNAYFNLGKLGARPAEYLPNFYGAMSDAINGDEDSDRLLVQWRLREYGRARPATPPDAVVALGIDDDGGPVSGQLDAPVFLVAVPRDIEAMRASDPALARRWRLAVREALVGQIESFDPAGFYVVRRES